MIRLLNIYGIDIASIHVPFVVERVSITESVVVLPGHGVVASATVETASFKTRNGFVYINFLLVQVKNYTSLSASTEV